MRKRRGCGSGALGVDFPARQLPDLSGHTGLLLANAAQFVGAARHAVPYREGRFFAVCARRRRWTFVGLRSRTCARRCMIQAKAARQNGDQAARVLTPHSAGRDGAGIVARKPPTCRRVSSALGLEHDDSRWRTREQWRACHGASEGTAAQRRAGALVGDRQRHLSAACTVVPGSPARARDRQRLSVVPGRCRVGDEARDSAMRTFSGGASRVNS
jgi:hypothetical protein